MKRSKISGRCLCNSNISNIIIILTLLFTTVAQTVIPQNDYVIAVRSELKKEADWMQVVGSLQQQHPKSVVLNYDTGLNELLPKLKKIQPRYLCVIDKPDNIDAEFVIEGNRMCRSIDDDIYDDYLWGIITGYSAQDALRIVNQSKDPFVLKTALSTTSEVQSGIWFDRIAVISDATENVWAEKKSKNDTVTVYEMEKKFMTLPIFLNKWKEIDPDIILTSSHATQYNLEMPFSTANIRSKHGKLYGDTFSGSPVPTTSKPRVYFPVGNCLIGDMDSSPESMAAAWLSSGGATAMPGYVVETWYGRNGWGALKFFLSAPEKHTLAEAAFLNRQDMYTQEWRKDSRLLGVVPDFNSGNSGTVRDDISASLQQITNKEADMDDVGFVYDRDVVVYYGDPAWNVRTQSVPGYADYEVDFNLQGKQCTITLKTGSNFSIDKISGKGFKEEHVKDIPLAYFFPERLFDCQLTKNDEGLDVAFDENFLLIYNKDLKPNKQYQLVFTLK